MFERFKNYYQKISNIFIRSGGRKRVPARAWAILIGALIALNALSVGYHLILFPRSLSSLNDNFDAVAEGGKKQADLDVEGMELYAEVLENRAQKFRETAGFTYGTVIPADKEPEEVEEATDKGGVEGLNPVTDTQADGESEI
jgi:hypothetical protein